MSAEKKSHFCRTNFDPLARVPPVSPPVYNSFICKDSCVRISARISSPLSLLLPDSEQISATQQGHESHQLDSAAENIRPHQRIFSRTFPLHGAAPTAQTEMTGKIMRSEALLDETHTQLVSPPRTPMVSLPTPPACLHLAFNPHPLHAHTSTRTHTILFWDPLETQEGGGSPVVEPLLVEFN